MVVLSSGCGDLFYHESYCDESVIMIIHGFLNIHKFFVTSVPGWGYAPILKMGVSMALYGNASTPRDFGVLKKPHSLLLINYLCNQCISPL